MVPLSSVRHQLPVNPPLALRYPQPCQSNGPNEAATWDWPTLTKATLIDGHQQRSAGTVTDGRLRWMADDAPQSVPGLLSKVTTSLSVYRCIRFKLLSRPYKVCPLLRKRSAGRSSLLITAESVHFPRIRRCYRELLSCSKISSQAPWNLFKHETTRLKLVQMSQHVPFQVFFCNKTESLLKITFFFLLLFLLSVLITFPSLLQEWWQHLYIATEKMKNTFYFILLLFYFYHF